MISNDQDFEDEVSRAMALLDAYEGPQSYAEPNIDFEAEVERASQLLDAYEPKVSPQAPAPAGQMNSQDDEYIRISKMLASALTKGAISMADIPQVLYSLGVKAGRGLGLTERTPYTEEEMPSHSAKEFLKGSGIDLESAPPQNALERIAAHGAEFVGGSLGGGFAGKGLQAANALVGRALPAAAKSIPYVSKGVERSSKVLPALLGTPENIGAAGKSAALAGGVGLAGGALHEESGINPLVSDLAASVLVPSVPNITRGIAGGVTGALGTAFSPSYRNRSLMKAAERDASEFLRKQVGSENVENILRDIEVPVSPEIGYQGTMAERTGNAGLTQLERAKMGNINEIAVQQAIDNDAIRRVFKEVAPSKYGIYGAKEHFEDVDRAFREGREKAFEAFSHQLPPEEVGEAIRDKIAKNLKEHKATRHEMSEPLYEKVREVKEKVYPGSGLAVIEKELQEASGGLEDALLAIKKDLTPFGVKKTSAIEIPDYIKSKELREQFKERALETSAIEEGHYPMKLKGVIKDVADRIKKAKKAGEDNQARALTDVRSALLEDLSIIPEEKVARQVYKELSEPVQAITKHKYLGKVVKRDFEGGDYKIGVEEIPSKVINKSMTNVKDTESLLKQIGKNKNTMNAIEGHLNREIINKLTDSNGNIDAKKLGKWKSENPGAFKLYPKLETKLKNVQNAQHFSNQVRKENIKEVDKQFKEIFSDFLGHDVNKVVPSILDSTNKKEKMKRILEIADTDKRGLARESIKRGIIDDMDRKVSLSSFYKLGEEKVSYDKFKRYMHENRSALEEAFDKEQMHFLDEVEKSLGRRVGAGTIGGTINSDTAPKLTVLEAINTLPRAAIRGLFSKFWGVGSAIDFMMSAYDKARIDAKNNFINKALVDKDMMKLLLTKVGDKSAAEKLIDKLKKNSSLYGTSMIVDYDKED